METGKAKVAPTCWYALVRAGLERLDGVARVDFADTGPGRWPGPALIHDLPQTAPPKQEQDGAGAVPGTDPVPAWLTAAPEAEPEPTDPLTPSRPEVEDPPVQSPLGAVDGAARDAVRFQRGRLLHTLLQVLPDLPADRRRAAAAGYLARPGLVVPEPEQSAWIDEVLAVLDDPAFAAVFAPGSRAEVPVVGSVRGRDGRTRTLSGQIDRLVVTDTAVLIVDFKTNRPPPQSADRVPEAYLRQMAAYRAALSAIYPGRSVRCALVWTDGPTLMPLGEQTLDRHAP